MQYKSSSDPIYSVIVKGWRSDEKTKFLDWALDNIKGQFMISTANSGSSMEHYSRPIDKFNHFGEPNDYSQRKEQCASIIMFTNQEDLSAFLIVFENLPDERYR